MPTRPPLESFMTGTPQPVQERPPLSSFGQQPLGAIQPEPQAETGLKGFATGVAKSELGLLRGTGKLFQGLGQRIMAVPALIPGGKTYKEKLGEVQQTTGLKAFKPETDVQAEQLLERRGGAEKAGGLTGDIASFLIPGGAATKLAKGRNLLTRMAIEGTTFGGVTAMREGEVGKEARNMAIFSAMFPVAGKALSFLKPKSANIMQRVARVNPTEQVKFEKMAGEPIGEYLIRRKIYGNTESIMTQLYKGFETAKGAADDALAKLRGDWKSKPVTTALDDLLARETRISSAGAPSKDLIRVSQLANKNSTKGLNMSEVNEVKRLYESNNKLDYLKQQLPESVARANTIDDAIRKWQFDLAEKLGFKNLPQINKETQLSKELLIALGKKNAGSAANNAVSITDWIMLSGGNPTAIAGFITKKVFSEKGFQSGIAKLFAPKGGLGVVKAETSPLLQLPAAKEGVPRSQIGTGATKQLPSDIEKFNLGTEAKFTPDYTKQISQPQQQIGLGMAYQNKITPASKTPAIKNSTLSRIIDTIKAQKEKFDKIPNKEGGFARIPFLPKPVKIGGQIFKQIDEFTKKEMVDMIDYLRIGKKIPNAEKILANLMKKYNINPDWSNSKISNTLEKLVEQTKTGTSVLGRNPKGAGTLLPKPAIKMEAVGKGKPVSKGAVQPSETSTTRIKDFINTNIPEKSMGKLATGENLKIETDKLILSKINLKKLSNYEEGTNTYIYKKDGSEVGFMYKSNGETVLHFNQNYNINTQRFKTETGAINKINTVLNKKTGIPSVAEIMSGKINEKPKIDFFSMSESTGIKGAVPQTADLTTQAKGKSLEEFLETQGEPLLHGTTKDFQVFDLSKAGTRNIADAGFAGKGIYLTNSREVAETFSKGKDIFKTKGVVGKERIIETYIDIPQSKILKVDSFGELSEKLGLPKAKDRAKDIKLTDFIKEQAPKISEKAKSMGYKAIKVDGGGIDKYGKQTYEMVVFDPANIKTKSELIEIWKEVNK